ncbi:MAG TPA: uroporphyrinogen-III synthase [Vicinamibacterales bacterium]|nr:uroporphyrinogen-III synthase [Vicinamibacterales bacterium]
MGNPSFNGLRVLVLESRRARELGLIVTSYGGEPLIAPSMREVPIESNAEAVRFIDDLIAGDFDVVVLLTGVGARALLDIVQRVQGTRKRMLDALRDTVVVARGPKPLAVMRELDVPVFLTAPEPNTWRELIAALDGRKSELSLDGLSVAVQEYGASNPELLAALEARGARVTAVPVYQWALPEDTGPLRNAARAIADGQVDVALFTSATQAVHLMKIADELQIGDRVLAGLRRVVIASIGPTTSEELRQRGLQVDLESSHPKMGFLAREAAERARDLLRTKRPDS